MVHRVNECQCVNTGAILLLRQGMFIDGNFSATIKEGLFVSSKAHGKDLIITLKIEC